ncbi:MAG: cation diffusion facilitator family transporter [Xanthomonadaceae bacterium]|nr:cation diffusion facilitator family transporter [Xanthomonadaceae bacterium]MDE2178876.1 cation diffusion facilitator family transporter [Xanthomonadaceae bacterium]
MSAPTDARRAVLQALGANAAIFVAKLGAALLTRSGSMLAEAVHSLADCGNQGLLLLGLRQARRPPSPDYPLGWGKALYFWSFLVALLLFSVGGMFSIAEGLHKLADPQPLRWPWLAVAVLAFGVLAESFSMAGALTAINTTRGTRSLWRWFRDSRQSELIVVFGEDLAALLGLALALLAVLATLLTGDPRWDALGSMAVGALLVVVALFIAVEVKALLIGQSVEPELRDALRDFIAARPEVCRVFSLITLQLGPDVMLAVKAEMAPAGDLIAAINAVERDLKARFPVVRWSFFEPDVAD